MRREKTAAATMPKPAPRERLLAVAGDLFYRQGIRSVGVDEIVAEANVAKMSLYRSFASKDELAAAYLEERDERYWRWWDSTVARHPGAPRRQLQARRLEQGVAVDGFEADPDGAAVAQQLDRDFRASVAAGPDLAVEVGEARHALVAHRPDYVANAHAGRRGRTALGEAGDDGLLVALGGVEAEPRPRRPVALAGGE